MEKIYCTVTLLWLLRNRCPKGGYYILSQDQPLTKAMYCCCVRSQTQLARVLGRVGGGKEEPLMAPATSLQNTVGFLLLVLPQIAVRQDMRERLYAAAY